MNQFILNQTETVDLSWESNVKAFFRRLWPINKAIGYIILWNKTTKQTFPFLMREEDALLQTVRQERDKGDLFFSCGLQKES